MKKLFMLVAVLLGVSVVHADDAPSFEWMVLNWQSMRRWAPGVSWQRPVTVLRLPRLMQARSK